MWSWRVRRTICTCWTTYGGKRVIVLGCGGGQDVVALDRMGAIAVGIDQSERQIEYARKFAAGHYRGQRVVRRGRSKISRDSMMAALMRRSRRTC